MHFDKELDVSGENCPRPVLMARKTLHYMEVGQVLKMTGTDVDSLSDIPNFCRITGDELVHVDNQGSKFVFYIRKVS